MGNIETVIGKNRSSEVRYKAQLSLKKENDKLDSIIDKKHLEHLKGTPVTESWLKNLVRIAMSAKYTKNPSINDVLEVYNVIPEEFKNLEITQKIDVMLHPPKVINVGDSMAVTTLYDVNGGSHELSEFKGKYIFFDFWSRFCGYCDPTNPGIKKVKDTYKDNLVVIGINVDNKTIWQEELKKYNIVDDKYGYQFNELNGEQFLYNSYNFKGYPSFALVSDEGKLLTKWSGIPIDDDFVSKISKFLP
ncbi:MAG: TlpA disulfide reductase family protein [Rikenellaceae bacterium]